MKVISSYQKLKLRIAELEKENHNLRKAIIEDDFRVLSDVKLWWKMREDIDRSLLFGERSSNSNDLTEHIRKYPTTFAEAFAVKSKKKFSLLPDFLKKKK